MVKSYLALREKYPRFIFKDYSWQILQKNLKISFYFKIEPDIRFRPTVVIKNINKERVKKIEERVINNLVFQLGLIEMLSYWKATCSPQILVETGSLNKEQTEWWKDLIMKGMGQFFCENNIDFTQTDFLEITSTGSNIDKIDYRQKLQNRILLPIGGGKDSVVTLEILKKLNKQMACFSVNPTKAAKEIIKLATRRISKIPDCENHVTVQRNIDKQLLELNRKGFLNGHTPFSAYLAFLSVFCGVLFDFKYLAFSNERSSDEGNLEYLGKIINHQYSKSFEFEQKFRKYSKKYLSQEIEYFSFLRPLYEIQTSKIFAKYPKYFSAFISCNEAFRTYSGKKSPKKKWCLRCPKCLFVFTSLYPFLGQYGVLKIFGENIFEKLSALPIMLELIGERGFKPFECVGTKRENLIAFYLSWKKEGKKKKKPFLLEHFERNILPKYLPQPHPTTLRKGKISSLPNLEKESKNILNSWGKKHNLPENLEKILKKATT